MSFHVDFKAATVAHAEELVSSGKTHLPDPIRALLASALGAMRHEGPVHVRAVGHICDGPESYEPTTVDVTVAPIVFVPPNGTV